MVFRLAILGWLGVATWQDLRKQQVSNWLTLLPLVGAILWRVRQGAMAMSGSGFTWGNLAPVMLLCAVGAIAVLPALAGSVAFYAGLVVVATLTGEWLVPVVWAISYLSWQVNLIAGADAKLAMALITLFPNVRLAALVVFAIWLVSLALLLLQGKIGAALTLAVRQLLRLELPTRAELEATGAPLVGAFALAFGLWALAGG